MKPLFFFSPSPYKERGIKGLRLLLIVISLFFIYSCPLALKTSIIWRNVV